MPGHTYKIEHQLLAILWLRTHTNYNQSCSWADFYSAHYVQSVPHKCQLNSVSYIIIMQIFTSHKNLFPKQLTKMHLNKTIFFLGWLYSQLLFSGWAVPFISYSGGGGMWIRGRGFKPDAHQNLSLILPYKIEQFSLYCR